MPAFKLFFVARLALSLARLLISAL